MKNYHAVITLLFLAFSCVPAKNVIYLQGDVTDTHTITRIKKTPYKLQIDDVLRLEITSNNLDLTNAFKKEAITTQPAQLNILSAYQAEVIITEGKHHQIKRMFGYFNNLVVALHRAQIGQLSLDSNLALGESRQLTPEEIESIFPDSAS